MSHNYITGEVLSINIEDPQTKILFYEREIYFLKQQLILKEKEIEARDRDIEIFKDLMEEVKQSRKIQVDLYERKVQDLKRTIEILQNKNL
jgi:hypothetical protein